MNDVARVPLNKRSTIRSTGAVLSIPKSTLYRNFLRGKIKRHRNAMQLSLTHVNMVEREDLCKSNIKGDKTVFRDMMNVIHINEKWFYLITILFGGSNHIGQGVAKGITPKLCLLLLILLKKNKSNKITQDHL